MKVVIVEDEKLAMERLKLLLNNYDASIEVAACLDSVEDTVHYLKTKPHPDVMLLDIHLSDGQSFEIFQQVNYQRPVIFTTAYDEYALDAFKILSVDYILKPVSQEALAASLNKLKLFAGQFSNHYNQLITAAQSPYKKRFVGKIGTRLFFINIENVSFFKAENKLVHLYDLQGAKYMVDTTMEKLETQIDPDVFFRINRSIIVHSKAIEQVKPYLNNRLKIIAQGAPPIEELLVSRERVTTFKVWANA